MNNAYLSRFAIAYPRGIVGRTKFDDVPAETVIKTLVRYNATSEGRQSDGRIRDIEGATEFAIEADEGRGITVFGDFHYQNLWEAVHGLCIGTSGDVEFVEVANGEWQFRYVPHDVVEMRRWERDQLMRRQP